MTSFLSPFSISRRLQARRLVRNGCFMFFMRYLKYPSGWKPSHSGSLPSGWVGLLPVSTMSNHPLMAAGVLAFVRAWQSVLGVPRDRCVYRLWKRVHQLGKGPPFNLHDSGYSRSCSSIAMSTAGPRSESITCDRTRGSSQ
jgi:hypothetical protein